MPDKTPKDQAIAIHDILRVGNGTADVLAANRIRHVVPGHKILDRRIAGIEIRAGQSVIDGLLRRLPFESGYPNRANQQLSPETSRATHSQRCHEAFWPVSELRPWI